MYNILYNSSFIVISFFLLLTLLIGIQSGRRIRSIEEYTLGNNQFNTPALILTFLATNIGGYTVVGVISETYKSGIIVTIAFLGIVIRNILLGKFIYNNNSRFKNCLTLGQYMLNLYGKQARYLTAFLSTIYCILVIAMQLKIVGDINCYFFGINNNLSVIVIGLIFILYSSYGGIRSVTYTDIIQFIIFIVVIPLVATISLKQVGGYKNLFCSTPKDKLLVFHHKNFYHYFTYFLLWSLIPEKLTNPAFFQRVLLAHNHNKIKEQFYIASIFRFAFGLIIMIISLTIIIKYPNMNPKTVFYHYIKNDIPNKLIPYVVISIIFILMTTADSLLNAGGVLVSNDLLNVFYKKYKQKTKLNNAKISTLIIGLISIIACIYSEHIFQLGILALKSTTPILLAPIIMGIINIKTDKRSFYTGVIFSILGLFFTKFYIKSKVINSLSIPISIILNAIGFMISHLIKNKNKIVFIDNDHYCTQCTENSGERNLNKIYKFLSGTFSKKTNIYNFFYKNYKNNQFNIITFGIFTFINFLLPYFNWNQFINNNFKIILSLRFFGVILATLCLLKSQWKSFLKPYFPLFWHFTVMYSLPFMTTVMFLITKGSLSWILNVGISIFLLIILVDGKMFFVISTIGTFIGYIFYKIFFGNFNLINLGFEINYYLIYQIFFPTMIGLLFANRKRLFFLSKSNQSVNMGLSLCHEIKEATIKAIPLPKLLNEKIKKLKTHDNLKGNHIHIVAKNEIKEILNISNDIAQNTTNVIKFITTFEKVILEFRHKLTDTSHYSIKSIIEFTLNEYNFYNKINYQIQLNIDENFYVKVTKSPIAYAIANIIKNSFDYGYASKITIWTKNNKLHIKDNGVGIQPDKIEKIFNLFYLMHVKRLGLLFVKQIVESFAGKIDCQSKCGQDSYTEFIIEFPKILTKINNHKTLINIRQRGIEEGMKNACIKIAKKMLKKNTNTQIVSEVTNLSIKEIDMLKKEIK